MRLSSRPVRRLAAVAAVLAAAIVGAGCEGNCEKLAERICSFYSGGRFGADEYGKCLSKVDEYFTKYEAYVKWEDENRCGMFLKSCTRQAIERGEIEACGLASAGPFSPCVDRWTRACDCAWDGIPDRLKTCRAAAAPGGFTAEQDLKCGTDHRDTCTCDALKTGDCAACGFPQCGPFSPCVSNWLKACDCTWSAYPEKHDSCRALVEQVPPTGAGTNPFNPAGAGLFSTEEDIKCGAGVGECTCEALADGECSKCGMVDSTCGNFSPCRVLGYELCECADGGPAAASACRHMMDQAFFTPDDGRACAGASVTCRCDTLGDPESCPVSLTWLFSPCRMLSYMLCVCPSVPAGERNACVDRLLGGGFTGEQEAACDAMKDTCACGGFDGRIETWQRACDCAWGGTPDRLDTCHAAAAADPFAGKPELQCGHDYRDTCTCDALQTGDCAACGFPQCGPFSPCVSNWLKACDCTWSAFPEKHAWCRSLVEQVPPTGAGTNPFNPAGAGLFSAEEDIKCGAGTAECTCDALAAGECARCGMVDSTCGNFSPCRVLGYTLCECAEGGPGAVSACRHIMDQVGFTPDDGRACVGAAGRCGCSTLDDGTSCPGSVTWLYTPCRMLSYELCACPSIPDDQRNACVDALLSGGFDGDQEAACGAMKDTCTCEAFAARTGCPDRLISRFGM